MVTDVSVTHSPVNWFTPGEFPSCSCGYAPRGNRKLNEHWAEHGLKWADVNGQLTPYRKDSMTMKTPEEVAREVIGADALNGIGHERRIPDMVAAIEADRAQHDLQYARTIIDKHEARAVIWEVDDLMAELEQMESEEAFGDHRPTDEDRQKIIELAKMNLYWTSLDDATEDGWDSIRAALEESIDELLAGKGGKA